jgi:hypothetical protein
MKEKTKIKSNRTYFLFALNICALPFPWNSFVFDEIISQSLNMKLEYKKPRAIKKEKGV